LIQFNTLHYCNGTESRDFFFTQAPNYPISVIFFKICKDTLFAAQGAAQRYDITNKVVPSFQTFKFNVITCQQHRQPIATSANDAAAAGVIDTGGQQRRRQ
jgi:hypothetical protein